jgi:hypothetical protein
VVAEVGLKIYSNQKLIRRNSICLPFYLSKNQSRIAFTPR